MPPALRRSLVVLAYIAGSVAFLWPMPAQLCTHIWGDRFDAWTTLWLMDHLHKGLASGTLTAETSAILFPIGYNLWSFGHAALQVLGVGLMLCGVPLVAAYNLLLIGAVASSGLAAHGLGRTLGGGHAAGFVAGVTFATSPYLYGEGAAGCIELVSAGFLPLFALTLVRLVREPSWRRMGEAALALAIVGPFNWYYTLFAGMMGLAFCLWQFLAGQRRAALLGLGAMGLAAALNAPLIPLVRRETPTRPPLAAAAMANEAAWEEKNAASDGTLPLTELTEARLEAHDAMQVIDNATTLESLFQARFTVNPLQSTPGFLAFGVGLIGALAAGRRGVGWGAIALGAVLLTLGPYLQADRTMPVRAASLAWPLPYAFAYEYLPFFSKAYRPYRIGVIALTACAALGAIGWAALAEELPRRAMQAGAAGLALFGLSLPFWAGDAPAQRPLANAAVPALYAELAKLPRGGVIELPLHYLPVTVANSRFQYNQVVHGQPLLNCNQLIRRTDLLAFRDYVAGNAFLSTLVDLGRREPPLRFRGADVAAAYADGFRYVVLHTLVEADDVRLAGNSVAADFLGQPAIRMLEETLGEPVLHDDDMAVYALPEAPEHPEAVRSWLGLDVLNLALPFDARRYGLPAVLPAAGELTLYEGDAREVSFWARPEAGEVSLRIRSPRTDRVVPLKLSATGWRWQRARIPEAGPVVLALVGEARSRVRITDVQVTP